MRAPSCSRGVGRAAAVTIAGSALVACSMLVGDPQLPSPDCSAAEGHPEPILSCEVAVQAAVESLTSSPRIQALSFQFGGLCPPNARCAFPTGNAGTVIITFADATQVSVYISVDAGQLTVEPPQAYPPPGMEL
jgi:hypothetical protein